MSLWDGIEEFVAVATYGSFTKGSKALGISVTQASRAVASLEQRLQAQLFHRTTRVVRLTDTGRAFLEHGRRMVDDRNEAIGLVTERGEPQGDIKLSCSTAMGERFIAPIMRRFALQNPKVNIVLDLTNRIVDLVAEGYDLTIRTGILTDSRLIGTRIGSRSFLTCASPSYIDWTAPPSTVSDLSSHECLVGTSSTWKFKENGQETFFRPTSRFRCNSGQAIADACVSGMGICQLPEFYVLDHLRTGTLRLVLHDFRADAEQVWAVYPERRHLSLKIRSAIDFLRSELPREMQFPKDSAATVRGRS